MNQEFLTGYLSGLKNGGGGGGGSSGPILSGLTAPTNDVGSDEDLYIQYSVKTAEYNHKYDIDAEWRKVNGVWVKYAKSHTSKKYLPYSDGDSVICNATVDNFDATSLLWGGGSNPVEMSPNNTNQIYQDSILINTRKDDSNALVNMGSTNLPFTAYIVCKAPATNPVYGAANNTGQYRRLLSSTYSKNGSQTIMIYGTTAKISQWADNPQDSGVSTTDWFVGVIKFTQSGTAKGFAANTVSAVFSQAKTTQNAGPFISIGRTRDNSNGTNEEMTDLLVKYFGVVNISENDTIVENNIKHLIEFFAIGA